MPTRSSKPKDHDFATNARRVVEQAIGEKLDGSPLPDSNVGKNPAAVALGRLGGAKGGAARAATLSASRRKAIAQKAAQSALEPIIDRAQSHPAPRRTEGRMFRRSAAPVHLICK